jgi:fatty-acyl-CoA synthase
VERFDAAGVLRLIEEERITMMNQVPTLVMAMLSHPESHWRDLRSLHSIMLGGAPVPAGLVRLLQSRLGVVSLIGYGMTEAAHISITRAGDCAGDKADTCGLPLPHVEIGVVNPATREPLGAGQVGEVVTRGFHVMRGYYRNPAATAEALDDEGWLHTGDLGSLDERGYLRISGRVKDMIIRGGENVYPREIEERLLQLDGVAEVAVVGLPDDYYGEIVAAFVKQAPGAGPLPAADLVSALSAELTGYKIPAKWFVVDDFPRTPSGKIQKFEIRDGWNRGEYTEVSR